MDDVASSRQRRSPPRPAPLVDLAGEGVRRFEHLMPPAGLFGVSVYDGSFGAGAGVMVLAVLLVTLSESLVRTNAPKEHGPLGCNALARAGAVYCQHDRPAITRGVPRSAVRVAAARRTGSCYRVVGQPELTRRGRCSTLLA